MGFADSIRAFELKALAQANTSTSNAVESLFTKVPILTPSPSNPGEFAQGHLADQWYPAEGGVFDSSVSTTTDDYGVNSLSRIKALLATKLFYGKDNVVTLTNNVSYAYRAEYLGWPAGESANGWTWSGKVGAYKMVSRAINEFKSEYI